MCPEIDIHQHLWPEPLLSALSLRREPPMLVRRATGWTLALVVPSTPLGIEALPTPEAEVLLAAYHEGVRALPDEFGAWASVGLAEPDPVELARLLDAGFVGACVGADAIAGPDGL